MGKSTNGVSVPNLEHPTEEELEANPSLVTEAPEEVSVPFPVFDPPVEDADK